MSLSYAAVASSSNTGNAMAISPSRPKVMSKYEKWVTQHIDPITEAPYHTFNLLKEGLSDKRRILGLCIVSIGESGKTCSAQGLDLRTREGIVMLLKHVYQLTPLILVKTSSKLWILELPNGFDYQKLRKWVFGLSESVGFILFFPNLGESRTVEGYIPNFWETDTTEVGDTLESWSAVESAPKIVNEVVNPLNII